MTDIFSRKNYPEVSIFYNKMASARSIIYNYSLAGYKYEDIEQNIGETRMQESHLYYASEQMISTLVCITNIDK